MMKFCTSLVSLMFLATPAFAYIGPGAGLGAIGVLIAIAGGVLLLLVGFLWYPLKRMMRSRRDVGSAESSAESK